MITTNIDTSGILTITLNRPEKLNALNQDVLSALSEQFTFAQHNDEVKAILIAGEGKAFCAGADINRLLTADAISGHEFSVEGQRVFRQLETLGKPSLAAINGFAFGGGCELAMSATLRVASKRAKFGQPEVKLGVIPGYGGTQRLARLVGKGRALDLCLTGRFIDADEALMMGLVTQLFESEMLISSATEVLKGVIKMGPLAVKATMEVIDAGFDLPLDDALHQEAMAFALTCATKDKNEGVSAFLEKRQANFTGE